jgi:hypothetical protein
MRLAPLFFAVLAIGCNRGRAIEEDHGTSVSRPIEGTQEAPPAATPQPEREEASAETPTPESETPDPGVGGIYGAASDDPAQTDPTTSEATTSPTESDPWSSASEDPWAGTQPRPEPAPESDPWISTSDDPWAGTRARPEAAPPATDPRLKSKAIPRTPQPSPPQR